MLNLSRCLKITVFVIMAITLLSSMYSVEATPRQAGVEINVSGPQEIFVNETFSYEIEVGGSFSQRSFNWSIEIPEVSNLQISPNSARSNTTNIFTINVTARRVGEMTILFRGFCSDFEEVRYGESTLEIKALKPGTVEVDVTNPTDMQLNRVKVGVFVDSDLRGSHIISTLGPGETKRVVINWSRENLDSGEHTLEIWVDYGFRDTDSFVKDEMILTRTFYITGEGTLSRYTLPISLAVVGVAVAGFFYYMRKQRQRRRPW